MRAWILQQRPPARAAPLRPLRPLRRVLLAAVAGAAWLTLTCTAAQADDACAFYGTADGAGESAAAASCTDADDLPVPSLDGVVSVDIPAVPAVVEVESRQVVTNDFPWITHDFFFEWRDHHRPGAPDLWPEDVREEMEQVMKRVFTEVNNGVYRCGFAGSQEAYDDAYDRLWTAMDWLEERLADRRYLMGDAITEADVRLFTTLARFDAVYHGHFKCNRNKLTEMPALWGYARDLFQTPGFGENTDFDQIKAHYYVVHNDINPSGIVPKGPEPEVWLTPHGRERV